MKMFAAAMLLALAITPALAAPPFSEQVGIPVIASGSYTPSQTNISNLASGVVMSTAQYLRVNNVVTVSGQFTATTGASSTVSEMSVTLPIASAFTAISDAGGAMGQVGASTGMNQAGGIDAHTADGRADFFWYSQSTGSNLPIAYIYAYTLK